MSVLAEGKAERWPPISLNTWSTPNPLSASFSLSLTLTIPLSVLLPLSPFFSLLIPGLARGLTALGVPACQKGPVIQRPPSGTGGILTHTYTPTHAHPYMHTPIHRYAHSQNTLSQRVCTQLTPTHFVSPSYTRTHTNIVCLHTKHLLIQKLLTALRQCSACCQHFQNVLTFCMH